MNITPEVHARITAAITAAETRTAGEISCVIAPDVADYTETPFVWASLAAMTLPLFAVLAGFDPTGILDLWRGWSAAHGLPTDSLMRTGILAYAALQALVFGLAAAVLSLPYARRALTPTALKASRVHRAALQHFMSHRLHETQGRTGVLLFVALAEHRAEVIADEGIYAKVEGKVWDEVNALLLAGMRRGDPALAFEQAIARTGEILAEHVPPRADNPNETPDRLTLYDKRGPR